MSELEPGRAFREAWIAGVGNHYPGTPKPGYVARWADTPDWERAAAAAVEAQIVAFARVAGPGVLKLSPAQRGQFVALCWIAQIHKHFGDPKPSYVADWDALPDWQQRTDVDIFDSILRNVTHFGG
ncbi:MAG: hypothetical protein ACT4RN_00755 [Pseudonocardia sp.]